MGSGAIAKKAFVRIKGDNRAFATQSIITAIFDLELDNMTSTKLRAGIVYTEQNLKQKRKEKRNEMTTTKK